MRALFCLSFITLLILVWGSYSLGSKPINASVLTSPKVDLCGYSMFVDTGDGDSTKVVYKHMRCGRWSRAQKHYNFPEEGATIALVGEWTTSGDFELFSIE